MLGSEKKAKLLICILFIIYVECVCVCVCTQEMWSLESNQSNFPITQQKDITIKPESYLEPVSLHVSVSSVMFWWLLEPRTYSKPRPFACKSWCTVSHDKSQRFRFFCTKSDSEQRGGGNGGVVVVNQWKCCDSVLWSLNSLLFEQTSDFSLFFFYITLYNR